MLTVDEIKTFISADSASQRKKDAATGWRYYEGHHDIEQRRIYFVNADGDLEEDKIKSNIRISHPFHREISDQVVQYILSSDKGYMRSDEPDLQKELDNRFNENEDFTAEMYKMLTGVVAKGWDYMYAYIDEDEETAFQHADSLGVIEVSASDAADGVEHLIYTYTEHTASGDILRVQVWDKDQVFYYCQQDGDEMMLDSSVKINPRPHTLYGKAGAEDGATYQNDGKAYGVIPFFRMDNFPLGRSDLFYYKGAIDDYDLMNCDLSNNLQDTNETAYVLTGFDGDNLDDLMRNFRAKKAIGVPEGGDVKSETVEIPFEARKAKMDIDRSNIYHFGQGVSPEALKDTAATTNLAIQQAYSQLDARAVKLRITIKQFLRKLLNVVLPEINRKNGTDYKQKDVYFVFEPEMPTNALENAQNDLAEAQKRQTEINTILNLQMIIGDETVLQLVCEQLDIDYNEIKNKLPKEEKLYPEAVQSGEAEAPPPEAV